MVTRPGLLWALVVPLLIPAKIAFAQQPGVDADLRCMAVMAKLNQIKDSQHQLESLIGGYYFLGRLQAVAPELTLGESTANAYAHISPNEFFSETSRCEQEMRANGHALTEIAGALAAPKADK